ncbi:MAG: LPS export ABC transporter periplasmic protein LptC [Verrucomicrobia bacterium]|nr:LPS export ABC transporter periplasmic protein LptC [Verrucomicrobiota bacterium]
MKSCIKLISILGLIGLTAAELWADKPKSERKIDIPIPVGHDAKGLRLPMRNDQGKLQFILDVEHMVHVDQANVQMHNSIIQTYDEQTGAPSAKIEMIDSVMNTETNILTTQNPVVITRDDFRLTGDGAVFNTKTRQGKVIKNVRLIIYNRDELQKKSPEQQASASEQK